MVQLSVLKLDKHQRLNMQPNVWEKFNTNQNIQYLTLNEQQFSQLDQAIENFRKEEAFLFSALHLIARILALFSF